MKTLTLADNFQWQLLTEKEAMDAHNEGKEVYILYDDGSEALAESFDDILNCSSDCQLGLERGFTSRGRASRVDELPSDDRRGKAIKQARSIICEYLGLEVEEDTLVDMLNEFGVRFTEDGEISG